MPNQASGNPGGTWPEGVGIQAIDIYFPQRYVDQTELETHDGVSTGKYTIGLGQTKMGFCSDREDVNSLCLTVVSRLLRKTGTKLTSIGRLEVGTETIVDKSKSVKSVLMKLFAESGNSDMEGVDSTNACYGGTAALFNSINWVESSAWDGRLALAVCADIAVYAAGAARPSGGAGAIAMLIGPNAPLVMDRGVRSSYMDHVYDFYKPNMSSEYPVVDGKLSIQSYLHAVDKCYSGYRAKTLATGQDPVTLSTFSGILFHTPYCKLVQKSLARLALNDFVSASTEQKNLKFPGLEKFSNVTLEETYFDRDVEKAFMAHSAQTFETKTKPSLLIATNVGNMYTPSVYGGLVSHLVNQTPDSLAGQKLALFSFGSGLASSFFSVSVTRDVPALRRLLTSLADVKPRLEARIKMSPAEFEDCLRMREEAIHAAPHKPTGSLEMFPGTWYLVKIDEMHRREYMETLAEDTAANNPTNGGVANGAGETNGHVTH